MKRFIILPILAMSMVALAADKGVAPGSPAPAFSLADQDGKTVNLADLKGKVVVLEWFNPGCPFVVRHYKEGTMNKLSDQYAGKDVVWLAVNSNRGKTSADNKSAADKLKVNHSILADSDGAVGKAYGAKATPHMFVIDKEGKVVYAGAIDDDRDGGKADKVNYVAKALDEVLAGKSVTVAKTQPYGCGIHY